MRKIYYILIVVLALPVLFSVTASHAVAGIDNLSATADAFVASHDPTTNFGANSILAIGPRIDPVGEYRTFIKFDLENIDNIGTARVGLYCYSEAGADITVEVWSVENDNWLENEVNWNNQPALVSKLDEKVISSTGWHYWFVTSWAENRENEIMSLGFKSDDTGDAYDQYYSRDAGGNNPILEVTSGAIHTINLRWETNYELIPDGDNENAIENRGYHLTFYYTDATQEFDMTENPETFLIYGTVEKIRLDVEPDNYWRTRIPQAPGVVDIILVDDVEDLDQYEFTLKDLTGQFGVDDNGQLWFSRYVENNFLHVHEDFWDAEDSVTAFLIYGKEYSLKLVTDVQERSYSKITADGILTKEISVSTFTMPDAQMIWDYIAWSTWWSDNDLKVSYQDNTNKTDNVTVNIYDENDNLVHTENFVTIQWTLTWTGANENLNYVVSLDIAHQIFGASTVSTDILMVPWTPPIEEEGGIPGIGQLGTLPFTWGAGIGIILVIAIAYTFGARLAGFCVLTMGMFLVMLGPVMGLFRLNPDPLVEWGFASFIIVMGVLMMLTKRGG